MGFNSFISYRIHFVIYVTSYDLTGSAQNASSTQVNVSARLRMNSFCECVLHATTCRNTAAKLKVNSAFYNSVIIIMLCICVTVHGDPGTRRRG